VSRAYFRHFILVVVLQVSAAAWGGEPPAEPAHYKVTDTIVILGAVPQEITLLTEAMGNPPKSDLWGIPYFRGNDDYLRLGPIAAREAARFTLYLVKFL
jgi:hypothetical protein